MLQGLYNDDDPVQVKCLRFCFLLVLQHELERVAKHWNLHKIYPSSNELSPHGRQDTIYLLPELRNTMLYLHNTANEELQVTKDVCCVVQKDRFSESYAELARMILRENILQLPANDVRGAEHLYIDILSFIEDLF